MLEGGLCKHDLTIPFFSEGVEEAGRAQCAEARIPLNRSLLFTDFDSASMYGFRTSIFKLCFVTKRGR